MALNSSLWIPIQDYIDTQKNKIPVETCYLYQSGYLGSPLNQCLRHGLLTTTLHRMYLDMSSCFKQLPCLNTEIVVYRCIPKQDIPKLHSGDIFSDKAFNSVSLKQDFCTYFGDVIFRIHLGHDDKLIALTGHQWFLEDAYECILPSGMQYKVISIEHVVIQDHTYIMYDVTSLGYRESRFTIDFLFDITFEQLGNNILNHISGNVGKSRLDYNAIFMMTRSQHTWLSSEYELYSFLNIDHLSEKKKMSSIFRLVCLYIDLLNDDVISIHKMTWLEARDRDIKRNLEDLPKPLDLPHLKY